MGNRLGREIGDIISNERWDEGAALYSQRQDSHCIGERFNKPIEIDGQKITPLGLLVKKRHDTLVPAGEWTEALGLSDLVVVIPVGGQRYVRAVCAAVHKVLELEGISADRRWGDGGGDTPLRHCMTECFRCSHALVEHMSQSKGPERALGHFRLLSSKCQKDCHKFDKFPVVKGPRGTHKGLGCYRVASQLETTSRFQSFLPLWERISARLSLEYVSVTDQYRNLASAWTWHEDVDMLAYHARRTREAFGYFRNAAALRVILQEESQIDREWDDQAENIFVKHLANSHHTSERNQLFLCGWSHPAKTADLAVRVVRLVLTAKPANADEFLLLVRSCESVCAHRDTATAEDSPWWELLRDLARGNFLENPRRALAKVLHETKGPHRSRRIGVVLHFIAHATPHTVSAKSLVAALAPQNNSITGPDRVQIINGYVKHHGWVPSREPVHGITGSLHPKRMDKVCITHFAACRGMPHLARHLAELNDVPAEQLDDFLKWGPVYAGALNRQCSRTKPSKKKHAESGGKTAASPAPNYLTDPYDVLNMDANNPTGT